MRLILAAVATASLLVTSWSLAAEIPSGPQPEKEKPTKIPGNFSPLVINGVWKDVNDKPVDRPHSVVIDFGLKPVVLVFARSYSDDLTLAFLKKLDAKVEAHKDQHLKGGVVFLGFDEKRGKTEIDSKELLAIAKDKEEILAQAKEKTQGLKSLMVAVTATEGPPAWKINKKADITIVLYDKFLVKKSFGLEKGDLDEKTAASVLATIDRFAGEATRKPAPPKK
jgi:hypothetical protein